MLGGGVTRPSRFYPLRSFYRLRFLPPRGRTLHPFGVLGIYAIASGRCVSFHQPVWDSTV